MVANPPSSSPVLVALSLLVLFLSPCFAHNKTYKGCFSKIYAFGDSLTDTGNAHFLGDLNSFADSQLSDSPYGSTYFKRPMNRLSDGRLLVDFLAETFSLPYLPPYQNHSANFSQGVNFAIAGSTVLPKDYFVRNKVGHTLMWKAVPESLQTQVEWYINFFEEQQQSECSRKEERSCMAELEDVLFWIGDMGVNGYARNFGTSVSVHSLAQRIVQNVMKLLKTLLDRGAKYIVVQGLPPTGCLPLDLFLSPASDRDETGCAAGANLVVAAHNDLLQRKLVDLEKQYPHCAIIYADYWNAFLNILKNPAQFGFSEPFKTCCGTGAGILNFDLHSLCGSPGASRCTDPTKHINWDGVHPTEAMNQKLANLLFYQDFCRPSFGQLIRYKKCT